MKIIKQGIMPEPEKVLPEKVYTNECRHCGTVYEFTKDEGRAGSSNGVAYDLHLQCPYCHRPNLKVLPVNDKP